MGSGISSSEFSPLPDRKYSLPVTGVGPSKDDESESSVGSNVPVGAEVVVGIYVDGENVSVGANVSVGE